jgi:hypothetical protein
MSGIFIIVDQISFLVMKIFIEELEDDKDSEKKFFKYCLVMRNLI